MKTIKPNCWSSRLVVGNECFSNRSACELTHFSKETPLRPQASNEQADAQGSSEVSKEMLPAHFHALTCLSVVTLEYTSPANRFPSKAVNEKEYLPT